MKNSTLITVMIISIIGISSLQAQERKFEVSRGYMFGAVGPAGAEASGSSWGISSVINDKWIATFGKLYSSRPTTLPPDFRYKTYDVPLLILFFLPIDPYSSYHLENETRFSYASFGRYYPVSRKFSFIIDGGLGLASQRGYNFYKNGQPVKSGEHIVDGVSTNYTVASSKKSSVGGIVRAGVDWAFAGFGGMGVELYCNVNAGGIDDHFGLNLRFMMGYMPRSPKKHKP